MSKKIMLTGPHGIGKTETIRAYVRNRPDITHIPSVAGPLAQKLGYDLNTDTTYQQMATYQDKLLRKMHSLYLATDLFHTIWDRSPLDFIAYRQMWCKKNAPDKEFSIENAEYIARCVDWAADSDTLIIVPLCDLTLPYEEKYNRPNFNEGDNYREAYQELILKMTSTMNNVIIIPEEFQYEQRVEFLEMELQKYV